MTDSCESEIIDDFLIKVCYYYYYYYFKMIVEIIM